MSNERLPITRKVVRTTSIKFFVGDGWIRFSARGPESEVLDIDTVDGIGNHSRVIMSPRERRLLKDFLSISFDD